MTTATLKAGSKWETVNKWIPVLGRSFCVVIRDICRTVAADIGVRFLATMGFISSLPVVSWWVCDALSLLAKCLWEWSGRLIVLLNYRTRIHLRLVSSLRISGTSLPLRFSSSTPWRHIGSVEGYLQSFLTSTLDCGEWLNSQPGRFTPRKESRYPLNGRLHGRPQSWCGRLGEEKHFCP